MIALAYPVSLVLMSAVCWLTAGLLAAAAEPAQLHRKGPLAALPSAPDATISRLKTLGDNKWLVLGQPAADPQWGRARGRSWSCAMAFAPDLHGAFLFGEGVHGWWNQKTGRYMDDLWFYDVLGHRWICYDPQRNQWTTIGALPQDWPRGQVNAFYDPLLNVHFFHVAGDSDDNGVIVAYRYKRATTPKEN